MKTINLPIDEMVFTELTRIKEDHGKTWFEIILAGIEATRGDRKNEKK